jgi:DNA-binding Xre family transcriptional regulator
MIRMSDTYIYFIQAGDCVKIGRAANVKQRLSALQIGSHLPLTLLGTLPGNEQQEKDLHASFFHLRVRGEWFQIATELRQFIDEFVNKPEGYKAATHEKLQFRIRELMAEKSRQTGQSVTYDAITQATGISSNTLSLLARGKTSMVGISVIERLLDFFGCDVAVEPVE